MVQQTLHQTLASITNALGNEYFKLKVDRIITDNLKYGQQIRPYQKEAFGRFIFYMNEYKGRKENLSTQLLFHMATGSGKTIIMAGLIIYLYSKGYRNFLFFVNNANIINKTRDNFLNATSSKYLFKNVISIGDKQIRIKEVDNFQGINQDDINIVFSTIQGLHMRLGEPKENSITYDDFENKKIVLISDEAHHINVDTKRGKEISNEELFESVSWEKTVKKIYQSNNKNILLEFTATVDFTNDDIANKYSDKLIYDYSLKQFRIDGYSKEVKILQASLSSFYRSLQAVILSQYRRKIFEKNKKHVKPVILFKSKTIKESEEFFKEFVQGIKTLKKKTLEEIKKNAGKYESVQYNLGYGESRRILGNAFEFFDRNKITLDNLIEELKDDFSESKCISVNSKEESEIKQIAVNTLEDINNEYRAIFAVDKLNEGWDVLNLFDIVRLYDTRDSKGGRPGKTTMAEAQLIGRGARYWPFKINDSQSEYQRKYDEDIENELRVCEELYYHSTYNVKYISELHTALEEVGIRPKKTIERELKLKEEFIKSEFYNSGILFLNRQIINDNKDIYSLQKKIIEHTYHHSLKSGYIQTSIIFEAITNTQLQKKTKEFRLNEFEKMVIRKALNKLEFYRFSNLKSYFGNIKSISEFINSDNYLGKIKVEVEGTIEQLNNLSLDDKLEICIDVLDRVSQQIQNENIAYKGTEKFEQIFIKDKITNKVLNISLEDDSNQERGRSMSNSIETSIYLDLSKKYWYVFNDNYGTSEEKYFVKFIDKMYDKLKEKYDDVYLVRNERHFKIYTFDDGRPIEPDFVLFLIDYRKDKFVHYQVFIEPKGSHLLKEDEWKQEYLQKLRIEQKLELIGSSRKFNIWGLPFYNEELKTEFEKEFNTLL